MWLSRSSLVECRPLNTKPNDRRIVFYAICSNRSNLRSAKSIIVEHIFRLFETLYIYYLNTESTFPVNIHCKTTTCGSFVADLLNDSSKFRQSASVYLSPVDHPTFYQITSNIPEILLN